MKILYLSCHSVLEYNEVKMFHEMGHEVFPAGGYIDPEVPHVKIRPPIMGMKVDQDLKTMYYDICNKHPGFDGRNFLTKEFVDKFDAIVIMHLPDWIKNNWENLKHKPVIWRTIGQSVASTEFSMKQFRDAGMKIVRYSPMERNIPGFIGEDVMIRFPEDPNEYTGWRGENKRVITFAQNMKARDHACNFTFMDEVTKPFPRHLYGPGNEGLAWSTGEITTEHLREELKANRVYFYTGTHPASYTLNFIESFMTGTPIVAIGSSRGNASYFPGHNLYEIPNFISNGINGFYSDSLPELQDFIKQLLDNNELAKNISCNARQTALNLFDIAKIKLEWKTFLGSL